MPPIDLKNGKFLVALVVLCTLSALTTGFWLARQEPLLSASLYGITVFLIGIPTLYTLLLPRLLIEKALRLASQNGLTFKNIQTFRMLAEIKTLLIDKTGTLTETVPTLSSRVLFPDHTWETVLPLVTALEAHIHNGIAQVFHRLKQDSSLTATDLTIHREESQSLAFLGVSGNVAHHGKSFRVDIGSHELFKKLKLPSQIAEPEIERFLGRRLTPVLVAIDGNLAAVLGFAHALKPDQENLIAALKSCRIKPILYTNRPHASVRSALMIQMASDLGFADVISYNDARGYPDREKLPTGIVIHESNETLLLASASSSTLIQILITEQIRNPDAHLQADVIAADLNHFFIAYLMTQRTLERLRHYFKLALVFFLLTFPFAAGGLRLLS